MPRISKGALHLTQRDPVLARIVTPGLPFRLRGRSDLYLDLLESIVSQQLSGKAAAAIFGRFLDLFPRRYPEAQRLLRMTVGQLRDAGVSRQKAGYLRNVAAFARRGGLDRARLERMSDEALMEHLTRIKGVGRWTAEMIMMFPLHRPDVFPVDDVGIQTAMKKLYGLRGEGPRFKRRMEKIADHWRPHRTLACKYLWKWKSRD
jgi:DNA-3-methyladenine glycosylase II